MAFTPDDSDYLPNDPRRPIPAGDDFMELFGSGGQEFEPVVDDDDEVQAMPPPMEEVRAAFADEQVEQPPAGTGSSRAEKIQAPNGERAVSAANQPAGKHAQNSKGKRQRDGKGDRRPDQGKPAGKGSESKPGRDVARAANQTRSNVDKANSGAPRQAAKSSPKPETAVALTSETSPPPTEKKSMSHWERLAAMLGLKSSESTAKSPAPSDETAPASFASPVESRPEQEPLESTIPSPLNELFIPTLPPEERSGEPELVDDVSYIEEVVYGEVEFLDTEIEPELDDDDDDYVEFAVEELDPDARESGTFGRDDERPAPAPRGRSREEELPDSEADEPRGRRRRRGRRGRGRGEAESASPPPSREPVGRGNEEPEFEDVAEPDSDWGQAAPSRPAAHSDTTRRDRGDRSRDDRTRGRDETRNRRPRRGPEPVDSEEVRRDEESIESVPSSRADREDRPGSREGRGARGADRRSRTSKVDSGSGEPRDSDRRPAKRPPTNKSTYDDQGDDFVDFGDDDSDSNARDKNITTWAEAIGGIVDNNLKSRRGGKGGGSRPRGGHDQPGRREPSGRGQSQRSSESRPTEGRGSARGESKRDEPGRGERPAGERGRGDRPSGDRPSGDRPGGDRDRGRGDRGRGPRGSGNGGRGPDSSR